MWFCRFAEQVPCHPAEMHVGKTVFAQIMAWVHPELFRRCVARCHGDYKVLSFSCWEQFLAMSFAQITYRESLADLEVCLGSLRDQLYHMGFSAAIAHSTLADANRTRDWRIYADVAQRLIARARRLYAHEPLGLELDQTIYALDSTTIDLCLSLFPWARFRSTKAAVTVEPLEPGADGLSSTQPSPPTLMMLTGFDAQGLTGQSCGRFNSAAGGIAFGTRN
jgi:hypothetical protein